MGISKYFGSKDGKMYKYEILKPVEVTLRLTMKVDERPNNRADEPNWGTVCVYMEMLKRKHWGFQDGS
jgi:hypothetical protein